MQVIDQMSHEDLKDYVEVDIPHNLTLEEKNELMFALLDYLNLRVMRAKFDSSFTVLTLKQ